MEGLGNDFNFISWTYLILLWIWLLIRAIPNIRWWGLEFVNSLTLYWFFPIIIIIPIAIYYNRPLLLVMSISSSLVFLLIFSNIFNPHRHFSRKVVKNGGITVMTFNILKSNPDSSKLIQVIRDSGADIVALQEVTQSVKQLIAQELVHIYPYQAIDEQPSDTNSWNGLISRIQVFEKKDDIPGEWTTSPRVFLLDYATVPIVVINIHAYPTRIGTLNLNEIIRAFKVRINQARMLVEYSQKIADPIIVLGDFNTTDQNIPYKLINRQLTDSWRETGRGLGLTFGLRRDTFGIDRPIPSNLLPIPRWLFRIDYIFHSQEWTVTNIKLLTSPNISDHRPVIATLRLSVQE
jgi:endonuclease/exonuclease/phosphatase family metal-dependent hydrolase